MLWGFGKVGLSTGLFVAIRSCNSNLRLISLGISDPSTILPLYSRLQLILSYYFRSYLMKKTNAIRLLDVAQIPYSVVTYEVDDENLSGVHVAEQVGRNPDEVFKTLVTRGDKNGVNIFCIPVNAELHLKKAAAVSGNKKIEMVPQREILALTGYIRGGCSPIGMKKKFPTYLHETAILYPEIAISAGVRGAQIVIQPEPLCQFIGGQFCDVAE